MGKVALKNEPLLAIDFNFMDASYNFDLASLVEKMKHKQTSSDGELNATILLKSPNKQIVLTALHKGIVIDSFQVNDSITFQIIEGKLGLHARNESVTLNKGQLLTLHEKIKYSLTSKEDTVLLLTIASIAFNPLQN